MKFLEDKPSCRFANTVAAAVAGPGPCMMYTEEVLRYPESPFVESSPASPPYLEPVVLGSSGNIFTLVEGLPSWRLCETIPCHFRKSPMSVDGYIFSVLIPGQSPFTVKLTTCCSLRH
ncbi:hypothetical protein ElyMa_003487100 [Elysia marginata]|uniref:Uncharacterized protein n=1 Tax=Elysia marginata TaxID=1093978 RepID=A0AAV4EDM8_9GAST|nr:hypothetical protein ElyMa_003487100 [Elysia marginata]